MKKIKLYLIDDHVIFLQSFQAYINTQPYFEVVGTNNGYQINIQSILQYESDIILLDYYLVGKTGIDVLNELRNEGFSGKIVFLSMNRNLQTSSDVRSFGANGFVSKDVDGKLLLDGLLNLFNGKITFIEIPSLLQMPEENPYKFTPQEYLIAKMICKGDSSDQVADKLFISIHTVHTHRRKILEKTKSENFFQVCQKILSRHF